MKGMPVYHITLYRDNKNPDKLIVARGYHSNTGHPIENELRASNFSQLAGRAFESGWIIKKDEAFYDTLESKFDPKNNIYTDPTSAKEWAEFHEWYFTHKNVQRKG